MPFVKGQSGNPAGRPRKPRPPEADKLRLEILAKAPELLAALTSRALQGDVGAARLLLERALPPLRAADGPTIPLDLSDLSQAPRVILSHIANGTLSPDQAAALAQTIASLTKALEVAEFESRLTALEASHAQPPAHA